MVAKQQLAYFHELGGMLLYSFDVAAAFGILTKMLDEATSLSLLALGS